MAERRLSTAPTGVLQKKSEEPAGISHYLANEDLRICSGDIGVAALEKGGRGAWPRNLGLLCDVLSFLC